MDAPRWSLLVTALLTCVSACGPRAPQQKAAPDQAAPAGGAEAPAEPPAPGFGGRLFDNWYKELGVEFVPDDPATDALDGRGGPFGNGTLPDATGQPMPNPGHDYRLKNLLGWDLRGAEGIYGRAYQNKPYLLLPNLLTDTDPRPVWLRRLTHGEDGIPAYGAVLDAEQIGALVDFLLAARDGSLPRADDVWELSDTAPKRYRLRGGGDATRGRALYAERCARCHGADGAKLSLEGGAYSLGSYARAKAYEAWIKVVSGQPGTPMAAQLDWTAPRAQQAQALRDLFAALCDRRAFPPSEGGADVSDGDPRCGAALR